MVCRGVAFLTGCYKVCRSVGAVSFPVPRMVYMEECTIFDRLSAELAGVVIPEEYGCTQGVCTVLFPSLVVFSLRERLTLQDCFQYLGVKICVRSLCSLNSSFFSVHTLIPTCWEPVSDLYSTSCTSPSSRSSNWIVKYGRYRYMTARPFFRSLRARYSLVGIMGFPVFPTTVTISFLSGLRLPSGIRTVYDGSPSAACALRLL